MLVLFTRHLTICFLGSQVFSKPLHGFMKLLHQSNYLIVICSLDIFNQLISSLTKESCFLLEGLIASLVCLARYCGCTYIGWHNAFFKLDIKYRTVRCEAGLFNKQEINRKRQGDPRVEMGNLWQCWTGDIVVMFTNKIDYQYSYSFCFCKELIDQYCHFNDIRQPSSGTHAEQVKNNMKIELYLFFLCTQESVKSILHIESHL